MGEAWFTEMADELARCLVDARSCAEAGEALLERIRLAEGDVQLAVLDALVAPIAVSRVLIELIDYPPQLALAAARLLAETGETAASTLTVLGDRFDTEQAIAALRRAAASSRRLIEIAA